MDNIWTYILSGLAILMGLLGLRNLAPRRKPTAAEIANEREKALVEKALADLAKFKPTRDSVEKRHKDKSPEEVLDHWSEYFGEDDE